MENLFVGTVLARTSSEPRGVETQVDERQPLWHWLVGGDYQIPSSFSCYVISTTDFFVRIGDRVRGSKFSGVERSKTDGVAYRPCVYGGVPDSLAGQWSLTCS
jgi:hypothetical protein